MTLNTVKFDPGIGNLVIDFNEFINDIYSRMLNFRTIHQKRAAFKLFVPKIENSMKNNIAFYFGCLLWAYYIHIENSSSPKEIEGNYFLNLSKEQQNNYDFMCQVNFMENYFDSFERDCLYYTGKKFSIPEDWKNILSLYSEFLKLNNGFLNTKTTADIVLPEKLIKLKIQDNINTIIQTAIEKKDLSSLLNIEKFGLKA